MLTVLKNYTPQEAARLLACFTSDLLPNPLDGEEYVCKKIDNELRERIFNELRLRARLKRSDNSVEAKAKLYQLLAQEMSSAALHGVNLKDVRTRLGQRGDLPPSLYEIEFDKEFRELEAKRDVSEAQVSEAVRRPDEVQHLLPEVFDVETSTAISLYAKTFGQDDPYTLLVLAHRDGFKQRVRSAWKIYHSEMSLVQTSTLLDLLKAFVDRYGTELTIGNKKGKFFFYETLPKPKNVGTSDLLQAQLVDDHLIAGQCVVRVRGNLIAIAVAFAIDEHKYREDLLKHGVRLKELNEEKYRNKASVSVENLKNKPT